jgi:hypothetical protein
MWDCDQFESWCFGNECEFVVVNVKCINIDPFKARDYSDALNVIHVAMNWTATGLTQESQLKLYESLHGALKIHNLFHANSILSEFTSYMPKLIISRDSRSTTIIRFHKIIMIIQQEWDWEEGFAFLWFDNEFWSNEKDNFHTISAVRMLCCLNYHCPTHKQITHFNSTVFTSNLWNRCNRNHGTEELPLNCNCWLWKSWMLARWIRW